MIVHRPVFFGSQDSPNRIQAYITDQINSNYLSKLLVPDGYVHWEPSKVISEIPISKEQETKPESSSNEENDEAKAIEPEPKTIPNLQQPAIILSQFPPQTPQYQPQSNKYLPQNIQYPPQNNKYLPQNNQHLPQYSNYISQIPPQYSKNIAQIPPQYHDPPKSIYPSYQPYKYYPNSINSRIDYDSYDDTFSSYGSSGYDSHEYGSHCCSKVVEYVDLAALILFIGAATLFLNAAANRNIPPGGRRKRSFKFMDIRTGKKKVKRPNVG